MTENKRAGNLILSLWITSMAAIPLVKTVLFDRIMMAEDVRTQAKKWVEVNIPSGSKIALDWEFYMPRLSFSYSQLLEKKADLETGAGNFSASQKRRLEYLIEKSKKHKSYDLYFLVKDPFQPRFLFAEPVLPFNFENLKQKKVDYVIHLGLPPGQTDLTFYGELQKQGVLMAAFSPYRNARKMPYDLHPLTAGPFIWNEIWNRERNGLPLEIYKVSR